jgi:O-antigen/teichoic acid export membrane protein
VILFFYGSDWQLSAPILAVFCYLGILYSIGNPMGNLILAKGRADIGFWVNMAQTFFLLTANYIGVQWGIMGVAFSTLSVTFFIFFPLGFFIRRYLAGIGAAEYLEQLRKPLIFSGAAVATVILFRNYIITALSLDTLQQLIVYGTLFVTVYLILVSLFDKDEILFLRRMLKDFFNTKKTASTQKQTDNMPGKELGTEPGGNPDQCVE